MAKSIPAIVTPEVLQWARSLDRITLEEIALKLKVEVAKVEAWENGSENPTLAQAKSLAKQYRVPFAYFYLPNTPQKIKRLEKIDYRTFGNSNPKLFVFDRSSANKISEAGNCTIVLYFQTRRARFSCFPSGKNPTRGNARLVDSL